MACFSPRHCLTTFVQAVFTSSIYLYKNAFLQTVIYIIRLKAHHPFVEMEQFLCMPFFDGTACKYPISTGFYSGQLHVEMTRFLQIIFLGTCL
jgi:hypothetical protein